MARSQLAKVFKYLRPHWRPLVAGTISLLVVNVLTAYVPRLIGRAVDNLDQDFVSNQLMQYVWTIFILASITLGIRIASRMFIFGIGRSVEADLKQQIFEHLLRLSPNYFANQKVGDLISIATSDVDNIRRLLGFAILSLINTAFAYATILPFMLAIDVKLTVLAISVYPLMFVVVNVFGTRMRDQQLDVQEQTGSVSSLLQEDLNGMALIKTYAQEDNERRAFAGLNQGLLDANLKLAKTRNMLFPFLGGIASVSSLILLWLGGEMLASANSGFTVGELIQQITYVNLLIFPTALLGFTITTFQRGVVSIDRVESILSTKPEIADAADAISLKVPSCKGKIEAQNLTYTYPGSDNPALDRVNFVINSGETVAIIGPVGSGKSTLANALPRLLDIDANQLFIDGNDITKIKIADLRSIITYVPQDSFLFSTTMRENIRYGEPTADEPTVDYYAGQARIKNEILNFPRQYETIVGERGITLSGGQRQRTALSRALLVDSPILLLDDALSSVDNKTATEILANLPATKTVIFISHQLSAAANADRLIVLDRGKIISIGTHQELLQSCQLYLKLWNQHKLEEVLK
ncbi:Xenobiotic-transporting ATPase [Thalassoporum mexicanum PCC 7367]|uniref:ABC transporter ATP-binding protein n=1 Tax=Thalassoporum mexicanum TaxID=3457544 RepID=UPI00029FCC3C|nr:ABC transporter ATP-binding protein [Pseudanabaena sp. PCC 7367]AFY69501.1 Xenobiotic-transporting ATPase [Pseudanabaena sp. PCC 7367]